MIEREDVILIISVAFILYRVHIKFQVISNIKVGIWGGGGPAGLGSIVLQVHLRQGPKSWHLPPGGPLPYPGIDQVLSESPGPRGPG